MRLRRSLALAAVATALSVALPALAYSAPRLLSAVAVHHAEDSDATHDPDVTHDPNPP